MGFSFRANYGNIMNTEKPSSKWETIYAYVVVNFYRRLIFVFLLFLGMAKLKQREKKLPEIKKIDENTVDYFKQFF